MHRQRLRDLRGVELTDARRCPAGIPWYDSVACGRVRDKRKPRIASGGGTGVFSTPGQSLSAAACSHPSRSSGLRLRSSGYHGFPSRCSLRPASGTVGREHRVAAASPVGVPELVAGVAEPADAVHSQWAGRKPVGVRLSPPAPGPCPPYRAERILGYPLRADRVAVSATPRVAGVVPAALPFACTRRGPRAFACTSVHWATGRCDANSRHTRIAFSERWSSIAAAPRRRASRVGPRRRVA